MALKAPDLGERGLVANPQESDHERAMLHGNAPLRIVAADVEEPVKISWSEAFRRLHEAIERRESHE